MLKFGIIGAGGIARTMARTIREMPEVESTAIAARDPERARAYAEEYGFRKAYGSYEELLADPEVELVYIALPHSHHCRWTLETLKAGKHVLCEKAFAVNEAEAREMIALSEEKGLLLAEAIWTRYLPSRKMIDDLIKDGAIGEVLSVSSNLGYCIHEHERIVRPELAGGALLDLTVYPLNFSSMVLGDDIASIDSVCVLTETGVDGQDSVTLRYKNGKTAMMFTTIYALTDRRGMIYGTKGFIEVQNINNPEVIRVWSNDRHPGPKLLEEHTVPPQITGFEYEVAACAKAIAAGACECPEMPHAETLEIMRQMDTIRAQFGIVYPFEK